MLDVDASVVVPAYNRKAAVAACLGTLACQDYPALRWEAIVVDDGSSDGTREAAESWRGTMSLTVIASGSRCGSGPARNLGVRSARGSVLIFIDSDVLAPPWFVSAHVRNHEQGGCFVDAPAISVRGAASSRRPRFDTPWVRALAALDRWGASFVTANASCLKADFLAAGGFDEAFGVRYGWEDSELGVRFLERGLRRRRDRRAYVLHWQGRWHDWRERGRKQEESGFNAAYFVAKHPEPTIRRWVERRLRVGRLLGACGIDVSRSAAMCARRDRGEGPPEWAVQVHEAVRYAAGFALASQLRGSMRPQDGACTSQ